jgi:5-formyltetrahydrofolate cyclo-ligase
LRRTAAGFPGWNAMSLTKAELRKQALARRKAVPAEIRKSFAEALAIEAVALARKAMVRTVAGFLPIGSEPDTRMMLAALDYHQFVTLLPVTQDRGVPLVFRRWREGQVLVEGPMGLLEPSARLPEMVPDFTFVPLAAFDKRGFRIGYGAGHYDATLAALRMSHPGPAVGIAFACQEIERVPEEDHDQPLDFVLTEKGLIDCSLAWT